MNTEYYRNFIAIVECGNILGASKRLMMAQPALSAQLKKMELEYGAELLLRGPRHIELTAAGRILYKKAKSIIALEEAAFKEVDNSLSGIDGTLSLALPPTNSAKFLEELLSDFMKKYPKVRFVIHEATTQETADCVAAGVSEVGYICAPITNSHLFRLYPLKSKYIAAVMPIAHPLASMKQIPFASLLNSELIVPLGCVEPVNEQCRKISLVPNISVVSTSRKVAIELAKMRDGIALVPFEEKEQVGDDLCVRMLSDCSLEMPQAFIIRKDSPLSQIARNFLESNRIGASM